MKKYIITSLISLVCCLIASQKSIAQEYKYEFGAAAGTTFYMGDANKTTPFKSPGLAAGVFFRQNINFHWAVKGSLLGGTISGNSANSGYPFPHGNNASFNRFLVDLGGQIEFNFFPYSDMYTYMNTKRYTPYIFTGAGATFATGNKLFFNGYVPIGLGFKYKLKNRVNIGLEFSLKKLFGDDLDAPENDAEWSLDAPYGIKSSFLKNQDWYSITKIFITWDFGLRQDPCCGQRPNKK